jgi:hypothetical protein
MTAKTAATVTSAPNAPAVTDLIVLESGLLTLFLNPAKKARSFMKHHH